MVKANGRVLAPTINLLITDQYTLALSHFPTPMSGVVCNVAEQCDNKFVRGVYNTHGVVYVHAHSGILNGLPSWVFF